MKPTLALASIDAAEAPHRHGHTCTDGRWWNPNAGTRSPCPIQGHLRVAREQVEKLHAQVHEAAHDTPTVDAVAEGMTGLVLADLQPEDRDGWRMATRLAIESLAEQLDRDAALEARAAAVRARLEAAGLNPDPS